MYKPETPKDPRPFLLFTHLAQLDRVSDYGSDGREFESLKVYSYRIRRRSRARSGKYTDIAQWVEHWSPKPPE